MEEQAKLKTLVDRYTSQGVSGAWRVYRWRPACLSLVLGDTENRNDVSGQWYNKWPLDTSVDSPIFHWLRGTYLLMVVNVAVEYLEPDEEKALNETLLPKPESNSRALPCAPPPQKAVLFCPLPGQFRHLKWWLTKCFADHLDIFYMYAEMGNDERKEMQLKFHYLPNPSVFVTTPKVGGTGLNLTAANHVVISQNFWVLNQQCQAFAWIVWLGKNRVPHTWLLRIRPGVYGNRVSDLHQLSGVAPMRVLHGLMYRLNITTSMIYRILECREDHSKHLMEYRDVVPSDDAKDEW